MQRIFGCAKVMTSPGANETMFFSGYNACKNKSQFKFFETKAHFSENLHKNLI